MACMCVELLLTISVIVLYVFIPDPEYEKLTNKTAAQFGVSDLTAWQILELPGVKKYMLAYFFCKSINYFMFFWLPYYLHFYRGYSSTDAAFLSVM